MKFENLSCIGMIGVGILFFTLLAFFYWLAGLLFALLWNWVVVAMFGAKPISTTLGIGAVIFLSFVGGYFKSTGSK